MPVRRFLVLMGDIQKARFIEIIAGQLQPDRTSGVIALPESAWNGHAGQAGEIGRQCENISQVVGYRIIRLVAEVPGDGRRNGAHDDIASGKGVFVVFGDQAADFLGLNVVGVIVAVA